MEVIVNYKGLKLIKKYGQYYIRFIGGQYEEYPCDLNISNEEALNIISQNEEIKTIRNNYMKKVKWTSDFFIDSGLKEYLFYVCGLNDVELQNVLKKIEAHEDIKMEFYETIMYEDFPKSGAIIVCDFTAEKLKESYNMAIVEAYLFLIRLREEPERATASLNL